MSDINERHRERMERKKAVIDAKIAAADKDIGVLIVNTGNGKGKSSSGFGMAMRAMGHGMKVGVVQFIKGAMSTGEEIPYVTAVVTEVFDESSPTMTTIYCAIYVERASQKKIVIGKQGARIKDIGTKARMDIEKLVGKKVFLKLFVKVVEDWRNRERDLDDIGVRE